MSYHVTKKFFNGYRCSCCRADWPPTSKWYDTLEEAVAEVPTDHLEEGCTDEYCLTEVKVVDGSTGDTVAWASLDWPHGGSKGDRYSYSRWSGYTPDESFDLIFSGKKLVTGRTWEEITTAIREKHHDYELRKAEAALKKAQADFDRLKSRGPL